MDISSVLTQARSPVADIRKNGEKILEKLNFDNFYEFLNLLAKELTNESAIKENRLLAATLIKNFVTILDSQKKLWLALPEQNSFNIKNQLIATLGTPDRNVRRVVGNTIASI
jgi:importin subunit beta-1